MLMYHYKACTANGQIEEGVLRARSINLLINELNRRGLTLFHWERRLAAPRWNGSNSLPPRLLTTFMDRLSFLLQANVELTDALDILSETSERQLAHVARDSRQALEQGRPLSQHVAQSSGSNKALVAALLEVGEATGRLPDILRTLAEEMLWQEALRKRFRQLVTYPLFVLVVTLLVAGFLFLFVVPQLQGLITSVGGELPASVRAVMALSAQLQSISPWFLLLPPTGLLAALVACRVDNIRHGFDRVLLRIPVVGNVVLKLLLARISRHVALLLDTGHDLSVALQLCRNLSGNRSLQVGLESVLASVMSGTTLSQALSQQRVMPRLFWQLVDIGERSGSLAEMFRLVAERYQEEANATIDRLEQATTPALTLMTGALIIWVVVSVFGPIYQVITTTGKLM